MIRTEEVSFKLPDREIRLKIIKNVEDLITDTSNEDKVPCWAEIWPAARGAARWIWNNISFYGESMLELGAGLGLPGVVCALKGARVTFSDFHPAALELAEEKARINGIYNINTHLGDWRQFNLEGTFNCILCSDITYDPRLNVYLRDIIVKHLSPRGSIIVAHPGRPVTLNFLKDLDNVFHWEKTDTRMAVTIEDSILPHQTIHIHYWRKKV